ncbi:MAG: HlyC/CorC family transporter [Methylophilaceae bacterium]
MDNLSIFGQIAVLVFLLLLSAFFSSAETCLMALNRYRLRHLVNDGHRGARLAQLLLDKTDLLLGAILLGNTFAAVSIATISDDMSQRLLGDGTTGLWLGTIAITLVILIFGEITPKVIAAAHAERLALTYSYVLYPLTRLIYPFLWFTNLFVQGLLKLLRIKVNFKEATQAISTDELRTIVSEAGHYIPQKNRAILLNLLDLETATVDDVMTAHTQIEAVNIDSPFDELLQQINSSHHTRILVRQGSREDIIGILHIRKIINQMRNGELTLEGILETIIEPYFIPSGTPLYAQIQQFQEKHQRLALVVDEYGELKGLVTLEDILEEIIGEFTTQSPTRASILHEEEDGSWILDGSISLRELNKKLQLDLPLDGPRTLNGLILERFEDIPEPGTSIKIDHCALEILQTQDKIVKSVRIVRLPV